MPKIDLNLIPEPIRSKYFMPHKQRETGTEDAEGEAEEPSEDPGSSFSGDSPNAGEDAEGAQTDIDRDLGDVVDSKMTGETPAVRDSIRAAHEERIVFDAWDNKQVRSVNEKAKKTLEKAGLELGDHTVDTVFKGSYMAVLKPRSQEYKRYRKLWKHPDLLINPQRWREWAGASAVRKYCLAEGIDVSSLSGSHFIELYYVKDLKLILTLAEDATNHNYTLRQLKRAVEELREHKDDHDPGKVIIKTLDQSVPLLDDPDLMDLCTDKDRVLEELSRAERKKIRALIKARKPGLDEWKNLMDTFEGILSDLEDE
ncbi:MAG: hypothetical protein FJY85_08365 [Deltaproteobacteria bacterium]|nr:hypothetical protein [Deltaproteobacteria bacterium]